MAERSGSEGETDAPLRVAYTVEQCWHDVPGGTAVAAVTIARELCARPDLVDLRLVAGRHPNPPDAPFRPPGAVAMLPLGRPWLYETWTRFNWPKVEAVTGEVDVVHATGLIPAATNAPLVVTVHDVAFLHDPSQFTGHGVRVMRRSLQVAARRARFVIGSSRATIADLVESGIDESRVRFVPLGVDVEPVSQFDVDRVRRVHALPAEYVLFVGTIEPRKNLRRLVDAMDAIDLPLVVAGSAGWGDVDVHPQSDVAFLGFVPPPDLRAIYAGASVFAYPSEREGFGLPVAEAMAQGTPVVTSRGTSTEEVAGGAAVLVDPFDVSSIAGGIECALADRERLTELGRQRAAELSWATAADATLAVYREVAA